MCGLTDVFIRQLVRQADTLGLMFDRSTVYDGVFELFNNGLVDSITLSEVSRYSPPSTGAFQLTKSSTVEAFLRNTTGAV